MGPVSSVCRGKSSISSILSFRKSIVAGGRIVIHFGVMKSLLSLFLLSIVSEGCGSKDGGMARSRLRFGEIGHYLKLGWFEDSGDFDQKAGIRLDRRSDSRRGTICPG